MRESLRSYLARADCDVKIQEDFNQSEADTIKKLDQYITTCTAVIHLVGAKAGAMATAHAVGEYLAGTGDFLASEPALRARLGDLSGLSYTQWESYLALHHHIPLFVYSTQAERLDESQQQHVERLKVVGRYPDVFRSAEELFGKLIGDIGNIITLPEPRRGDLGEISGSIKAALIDTLSQFPDFFVRPVRFFGRRFERRAILADALVFAAIMSLAGFAASVALRVGERRLGIEAIAAATLGNVTLWMMYAVFLQPFVYFGGARRGVKYTLSAYLYTIGAVQPILVVALFAIQLLVPDAVDWGEVRAVTLGGSGGSVGALLMAGNMLSSDAVAYYRIFGGLLILVYFGIGISVGHRLAWWRSGLAIVFNVVFFVIVTFIFWLIATLAETSALIRVFQGT